MDKLSEVRSHLKSIRINSRVRNKDAACALIERLAGEAITLLDAARTEGRGDEPVAKIEDGARIAYRLGYQDGYVDGRWPEGYDGDEREAYAEIDGTAMSDGWQNLRETILSQFPSPIREPEISREDYRAQILSAVIGVLDQWHDGLRERKAVEIADAILNLAPVGGRGAQLEEIAALARELITTGMVNRGVDRGLVVVERDDKTDPHYRLCSALARLPPPPQEQGGMK